MNVGKTPAIAALLLSFFILLGSHSFAGVNEARRHIYKVMDKYHQTSDVYTDLSAAGNHFVAYGMLGDLTSIEIIPSCRISPYSGDTCFENSFTAAWNNWGGCYFMNGVLEHTETKPKLNWGNYPDAGVDLTGADQLTFWARGAKGGERVEFFAFGVGRNADNGRPFEHFPDSSRKVSLGYRALKKDWTQYKISLRNRNLSYVLGGFGWVTNAPRNKYKNITFYLDDIRYNKSRLNEPRFLVSYEAVPSSDDFDMVLKNTAFTYDNALVLISLLATASANDINRAQLIADAFVYAIDNDRFFTDGRLRDTYQGGDLVLPPGWTPNGNENTVRMTGWWDPNDNKWCENAGFVGTSTGNLAWAIIALLSFYEQVSDSNYLDAAKALGQWIENNTRDSNGPGGYSGGYEGWEPTINNPSGQTKLSWKSTEHNLDVYVAFMRLHDLAGEPNWLNGALHAQTFVNAMWDANEGHFWTGTMDDGVTINKSNIPLDVQAWAVMAIDGYDSALGWAENNCYTEADGFKGFDFNNDRDGIWFEGTAQMTVAYQINDEPNKVALYLSEIRKAQASADNNNSKGIVAASHDYVSTGFGWYYFNRLHIGATAWYIFAEMGYNPYWGTRQTGSLQVTINPTGAIVYGAKWRRVGTDEWRNSGDIESGIPVGSCIIEFGDAIGWKTPENQNVLIGNSRNTNAAGTYTPLNVTKCAVIAGKKANTDKITFSGTMSVSADDIGDPNNIIEVTISSGDLGNPCVHTFIIDGKTFKKGKYSYSGTDPNGVKKSFTYDTKTRKFAFSASNLNLKGLGCPVTIEITVGSYAGSAVLDEAIVNGTKPVPIQLMTGVKNVLRVDKCTVKKGKKLPNTDQLTVSGAFAVEDPNMSMNDRTGDNLVITLNDGTTTQTFTVSKDKLKAGKGKFSCTKAPVTEGGTAAATFNFNMCSFTLTIKNTQIMAAGDVDLRVQFAGFDKTDNVSLP
ncbi:MAG: hypothetical protein JW947_01555 [Sedimentisphaerales bacterium]|nr:hypothetical protein [Sedimentisphaerales bacterium]